MFVPITVRKDEVTHVGLNRGVFRREICLQFLASPTTVQCDPTTLAELAAFSFTPMPPVSIESRLTLKARKEPPGGFANFQHIHRDFDIRGGIMMVTENVIK